MGSTSTRRAFVRRATGALAALGLAAAPSLTGCAQNDSPTEESGEISSATLFVFDTVVSLRARCPQELMDQLAERCRYFEGILSRTVEGSDIWNVNHALGAPVEVSAETAEVVAASLDYSRASDGLFDVTIGAVSSLWDFDGQVVPSDTAITEALAHVGYEQVHVDGTTITLDDPAAMLDLGGIAKGYIADDLARTLRAGGCEDASISLGGNVYVLGQSFDGDPWNVGVRDPFGAATDVVATIELSDESLVTSGPYERSFERDGVLYHHILDPRTGYPAQSDLASSSLVSAASIDGDAWSTILFLLGRERALEALSEHDELEGLLVGEDGGVDMSAGAAFIVEEGAG